MNQVYSRLKMFAFPEKIASLPRTVPMIKPPIHIRIKPTNRCNHRCRYCAYRDDAMRLGVDMDERDVLGFEKLLAIIDECNDMGVKAITFSGGGEPFCYPRFDEILQRLATTDLAFAALTNGSLLTGEPARLFSRFGTWIRVSIDGWDSNSYARYRGVSQREFNTVLENMSRFKELGGPCYLGVSIIVDGENAPHLFSLCRTLKRCGVDSVKLSPCIVSNDGGKNNEYHRPHIDLVKEQAARIQGELADDRFELFDSFHLQLATFQKPYHWCPYLQIMPVIGADGYVYSCHDKAYDRETGVLGSCIDTGFRDMWMSSKERFFAIDPSRVCNHHCVAHQMNMMLHELFNIHPDHIPFV